MVLHEWLGSARPKRGSARGQHKRGAVGRQQTHLILDSVFIFRQRPPLESHLERRVPRAGWKHTAVLCRQSERRIQGSLGLGVHRGGGGMASGQRRELLRPGRWRRRVTPGTARLFPSWSELWLRGDALSSPGGYSTDAPGVGAGMQVWPHSWSIPIPTGEEGHRRGLQSPWA